MANEEQLAILKQGVEAWNEWRLANPTIKPDLYEADLSRDAMVQWERQRINRAGMITRIGIPLPRFQPSFSRADFHCADLRRATLHGQDFSEADFSDADLSGADLRHVNFTRAILTRATLEGAFLSRVNLFKASLCDANLRGTDLSSADFSDADLRGADLQSADLTFASLINVKLQRAKLSGCHIYGISVWDLQLDETEQMNLIITPYGEPEIAIDSLEIAQFIYLLLNNQKIRNVIDTITSKVVLILGRFTPERKAVLDTIRDELRRYDLLPVMFDFERPDARNYIETVSTLAHMARFIIADVSDAKVILQELQSIVPTIPSVPVQPIIHSGSDVNAVILDFVGRTNFIQELFVYQDLDEVKTALQEKVIARAEARLAKIEEERQRFLDQIRTINR